MWLMSETLHKEWQMSTFVKRLKNEGETGIANSARSPERYVGYVGITYSI